MSEKAIKKLETKQQKVSSKIDATLAKSTRFRARIAGKYADFPIKQQSVVEFMDEKSFDLDFLDKGDMEDVDNLKVNREVKRLLKRFVSIETTLKIQYNELETIEEKLEEYREK